MGDAMEEGTILQWLKNVGDRIAEGDIIAEINTEKATIEIPATDAGTLAEILVAAGQTVPVGTVIGRVGSADSTASAATPPPAAPPEAAAPPAPASLSAAGEGLGPTTAPAPFDLDREPGAEPRRVKASPLARKVAAEHKLDLAAVSGTGPGGRIVEADVAEALARGQGSSTSAPAIPASVPAAVVGSSRALSPMRRVIAQRLTQSKQTVPHFYLTVDVDMRAAHDRRAEYNTVAAAERKISFNDLIVRACALALASNPAVRSQWDGDAIRTADSVDIGVAVSLDDGLIVPIVRGADGKSVAALGAEVRALAERARAGKLQPSEYSGGCFTISNLGMYGIVNFSAIINPPESAILAVGAIREVPIVEDGAVVPGRQMNLTLSADHRVVDGAAGAVFLQQVQRLLESPMALFG